MKIIFLKNVKNQGKKGDIKEVKDGYAENFLIRNGYAEKLTEQSLSRYNRVKKKEEEQDKEMYDDAKKIQEKLKDITLSFKVKTGTGDKVFGSISPKQIKDELDKLGYKIDKKQIVLDYPIASLGFHDVKINLYKEVYVKIKVQLVK